MNIVYILVYFAFTSPTQKHSQIHDTSTGAVQALMALPSTVEASIFKAQEMKVVAVSPKVFDFEKLLDEIEKYKPCGHERYYDSGEVCVLPKGHKDKHNLHDPVKAHGDKWKLCELGWFGY